MKHFLVLFFLHFLASSLIGQNFSNKGKDFWVAYGYHVKMNSTNGGNAQDMVLYFATEQVTTITITIPSLGYTQTLTSGATPTVLTSNPIPKTGTQDARLTAESTAPEDKAIHIVSDKPIVAYAHIYNSSVSGACILFPTNTLGKEYYSINYTQISNENYTNAWFYVIATDTGTTTVEITPSANTINHPAGVPFTITMTQGQVFNLMGELTGGGGGGGGGAAYTGVDLTGSKIKSIASGNGACKRIAVYSGSGKLSITCSTSSSSSDNYMVQAFPKDAWGKKFLTAPTSSLNNNVYRVCVLDPAAAVTLNGAPIPYPLTNNFYYEVPVTTLPMKIESDLPITVAQYIASQGACGNPNSNSNPGDPEVIYLSPVEQNISKVLWNATPNFNILEHYYNVVIPNGGTAISSFKLDGVAVSPALFTVHPQDPAYSYLSTQLANSGVHTIESDSGFNAIAYGFGSAESYGYNAGTNIKPFVPIRAYNPLNISGSTVACSGTNAYLTLTFPFQPTSLSVDFHNSPYQTPNTNVSISDPTTIFDSIHIEGSQQYWCYHLPTFYYFNVNNPALDSSSYQISINGGTNSVEGCGNSFVADYDLYVYNPATVKFAWANNGCVNDPVLFTDTTNYSNNTFSYIWNWDFGDNNTSTAHNPSHLFSSPGTYEVNFSLVTNVGCVSDTTISVTVYPLSYGTVTGTTSICNNTPAPTLTFNATSGTSPFVFNYSINGGASQSVTSTTNTATITAPTSTPGIYNYTLNSIQGAACLQLQNASPAVVTVNPLPTATISGTTAVCHNATSPVITFTGGGATAPYTFSYQINNGPTQTITSVGNVATINAPTNVVGTFTYTLLNVVDGSSTACAQLQNGTATITVNPLPTATISGTTALCLNATSPDIEFTGANGTAPYTFTYNINGGPNLTVTTTTGNSVLITAPTSIAGVYNYQLISVQDASITQCIQNQNGVVTITVYREPLANFSYTPPACPERTIQFNDLSIPYSGTITEWHWNFGDATPVVTTQNPIHNFALPGTYQVKLYVKTSNDCFSPEITIPVTINPLPVVGFINPEVCLSDTYAQFTDTSSVAGGTITNWLWDFSDPTSGVLNTSTLQNPRHSYTTIGTKNVKLIVTTNSGCVDTIVQSFFVNGDIPVAGLQVINPNGLCANDSVRIKNTSTVNVGSVVKVQIYWDFLGNPTVFDTDDYPYPNKIYAHLYNNFQNPLTQTFKIRFRAYSGETCIDDYFQDITINAAPKVQFNVIPDTCRYIAPFQITQASEIGGVPGTYTFSGTGITPAGIFDPAISGNGTFTLHYVFTSNRGCSDSADKNIKILVPPVANFGYISPFCEGSSITFTDTSAAPVGNLTTWTWNFSDGTGSLIRTVNTNFTHTFISAGDYDIHLMVTTNNGCNSLDKIKSLHINPRPVASFQYTDTACLPNALVEFENNSFIADGTQNTFSYLWNFGDATSGPLNTSVAFNPSHIYNTVGPYSVKLKVTSGAFCVDDTIISVNTIHPQPHADFSFTKPSVCIGDNVKMNDLSDPKDGTLVQWYWNFDDGQSSSLQLASHTYSDTGVYSVMHYIVNSFGCVSDTMFKLFNVYPYPVISAGPDLQILEGQSAPLQATAIGTNLNYIWTTGTYLNSTNVLNPVCTPIDDITYTLTVTGIGGCPTLDQVRITVLKMPLIPNTFSPNKDGINDLWEIEYLKDYPRAKVKVFTRTGQLVFESAGYLKPWDGTKSGKPLPLDTYYYIIEPESGRAPVTGYITIIK